MVSLQRATPSFPLSLRRLLRQSLVRISLLPTRVQAQKTKVSRDQSSHNRGTADPSMVEADSMVSCIFEFRTLKTGDFQERLRRVVRVALDISLFISFVHLRRRFRLKLQSHSTNLRSPSLPLHPHFLMAPAPPIGPFLPATSTFLCGAIY